MLRKRQKKGYYHKRKRLLDRMVNQSWVLFVLGLASIRDLLASFEEGQQDVLGRIAWRQEFDVDQFVADLAKIRDELKNGNIEILPRINEHYNEVKNLQYLGTHLKDTKLVDGLSKEEMLKFTFNDENKTLCSCKQPVNEYKGESMVACDFCETWFNCDCVGLVYEDVIAEEQ